MTSNTAIDRVKESMRATTATADAERIPKPFGTSGTSIAMRTGTCGPSYDPYGWETITVYRHGLAIEFTACGLRGVKTEVHAPAKDKYGRDGSRTIAETDWCFDSDEEKAVKLFERFAGADPGEFRHWYEERIYVPDPMGSMSWYC